MSFQRDRLRRGSSAFRNSNASFRGGNDTSLGPNGGSGSTTADPTSVDAVAASEAGTGAGDDAVGEERPADPLHETRAWPGCSHKPPANRPSARRQLSLRGAQATTAPVRQIERQGTPKHATSRAQLYGVSIGRTIPRRWDWIDWSGGSCSGIVVDRSRYVFPASRLAQDSSSTRSVSSSGR